MNSVEAVGIVDEVAAGRNSSDVRLSPNGQNVAYAKGQINSDIAC